jgi:2-polyprenyl-6-methoxyphenol hydroxylase-like FAD-dependent oxidoreductase
MTGKQILDVVVIGAGQAGLGVSYYLQRAGLGHRVLDPHSASLAAPVRSGFSSMKARATKAIATQAAIT